MRPASYPRWWVHGCWKQCLAHEHTTHLNTQDAARVTTTFDHAASTHNAASSADAVASLAPWRYIKLTCGYTYGSLWGTFCPLDATTLSWGRK